MFNFFNPDVELSSLLGVCQTHHTTGYAQDQDHLDRAFETAVCEVMGLSPMNMLKYIFLERKPFLHQKTFASYGVVWLRENMPDKAGEVLRQARDHYRSNRPGVGLTFGLSHA